MRKVQLGRRRFHVVARHLQKARQFAFPLAWRRVPAGNPDPVQAGEEDLIHIDLFGGPQWVVDYLGLQRNLRGFCQNFPQNRSMSSGIRTLGTYWSAATLGIAPPGPHCDGGGTSRRNLQRQGMGSLHNYAVIQHGRPAQVYGAQERVEAISTWSKLSGQASILGISYTHRHVYSIRDGRMAVSPSHRAPSSFSGASSKRRMPRSTC